MINITDHQFLQDQLKDRQFVKIILAHKINFSSRSSLSTLVDTLDGVEEPLVSILVPGLPMRRVSGTFA